MPLTVEYGLADSHNAQREPEENGNNIPAASQRSTLSFTLLSDNPEINNVFRCLKSARQPIGILHT